VSETPPGSPGATPAEGPPPAGGPQAPAAAPGGSAPPGAASAPADDEVVEAEVVDGAGDFGAGAAPTEAEVDAAAEAVEVDLELLLSERAQYLDAYRRAQADFENYKKQVQRRQDDAVVRSLGGFVEGLLPVLDACDAAAAHGAGEQVEPIVAALYGALEKEGLERIDPAGGAFDPAEAEAVLHVPGDGGAQVVAETLRTGYRWRGRILRPAMVKVTD
jgi:molecular chaperone GrpE